MAETARVIMEVQAGVVPGTPERSFNRKYVITSREWEESEEQGRLLAERNGEALGYASLLMGLPDRVNWVRVEWIWL